MNTFKSESFLNPTFDIWNNEHVVSEKNDNSL